MADLITNESVFLEPIDYGNRDASEQAFIDGLIAVASEYIERKCNRVFIATTYIDEIHDGQGWNSIFVSNPPINSLTDIEIIFSSTDTDTTSEVFTADKFKFNIKTGDIRFKPGAFTSSGGHLFPDGFRNVEITYNGGFAEVPQPIQMLTADFVIQSFDPTESVEGIEKEKIGDYFYAKGKNYIASLPFLKKQILNNYRVRRV